MTKPTAALGGLILAVLLIVAPASTLSTAGGRARILHGARTAAGAPR